jgi:ABC-type transporter Mla subunit MlaD
VSVHITFDSFDDLFGLLLQSKAIVSSLGRLETAMADLSTDFANLGTQVTRIVADVASVLDTLKNQPNITADQQTQLESQIAALTTAGDQLEAAMNPTPNPAPVDPNQPSPAPVDPNAPPAPTA